MRSLMEVLLVCIASFIMYCVVLFSPTLITTLWGIALLVLGITVAGVILTR